MSKYWRPGADCREKDEGSWCSADSSIEQMREALLSLRLSRFADMSNMIICMMIVLMKVDLTMVRTAAS